MELKKLLWEQVTREHEHLSKQEVGSDEYNQSFHRLNELEDKLADLVKFESESARKDKQMEEDKKDRSIKNVNEYVKTASGIALPLIGLVAITAFEKGDTFTSSLKGIVNCFIPKKMY